MKRRLNYLQTLIVMLMCVLMSLSLTACSSDDDGDPGDTSAVVGLWRGSDYDHFYSNVTIRFDSDGTGYATIEHVGAYVTVSRATFTYKVKGKKVTTKGVLSKANSDGETETRDFNNTYEISGNTLYVRSGEGWYTNVVKSYRKE